MALGSCEHARLTPMCAMLAQQPGDQKLLGGGRRASTIRARTRLIKDCLTWLPVRYEVSFPRELVHLSEFLRARFTELALVEHSWQLITVSCFWMRSLGRQSQRITPSAMCEYSSAGSDPEQAPRMLITVLSSIEVLEVEVLTLPYLRVFAWWLLVQSWTTLRFSDHRGISPNSVKNLTDCLSSRLTRSKTMGTDKCLHMPRTIVSGFSQGLLPFIIFRLLRSSLHRIQVLHCDAVQNKLFVDSLFRRL